MATLEKSVKAATGIDSIFLIRDLIKEKGLQNTEYGSKIIFEMDSVDGLGRKHHDWLKEQLNYTCFYGAIRVPFDVLSARFDGELEPQRGEILVSFSGASQEQDVMFAMAIFHAIQVAIVAEFKKSQFWFKLRDLEEIPNIKLWIDNLDVRETAA